jgi:aminoglycoside/choline kinase family phosphotransferase
MEASGSVQVPLDLLLSSLGRHLGRDALNIEDCDIQPIETDGASGNHFYRAVVSLQEKHQTTPITLIIKRWLPTAWTALLTGAEVSREALAWENGLITERALPEGLKVPFIATSRDEDGAWIVMEDISSEIAAFKSPARKHENARLLLDRLAGFHVFWECPDRFARLQEHPWLFSQEARLHCGVACHLKWFGADHKEKVYRERLRRFKMSCPDSVDWARSACSAFIESIPRQNRELWRKHIRNREALVAAFGEYAQVLVHGDLNERNAGIRKTDGNGEVYIVDWEWAGMGAAAIDVVCFVYHFFLIFNNDRHVADEVEKLEGYYFDRYIARGGQKMDHTEWQQSCELAHVYYGLQWLPAHGGLGLLGAKKREEAEWVTRETERVTEMIKRLLH